jgi:hypothetical protein
MGLAGIYKIDKEAYLMIKKYGYEKAQNEAILTAESYIDDISKLTHYDKDRIKSLDDSKMFWLSVGSKIQELFLENLKTSYEPD